MPGHQISHAQATGIGQMLGFEIGPDRIILDCPIALTKEAGQADARFLLAEGARVVFVLTY